MIAIEGLLAVGFLFEQINHKSQTTLMITDKNRLKSDHRRMLLPDIRSSLFEKFVTLELYHVQHGSFHLQGTTGYYEIDVSGD